MGKIACDVAVTVLFLSMAALFASGEDEDDYHFGDCGGKGAMPPKGKRGAGYIPGPEEKERVKVGWADYVYAEGRVACPSGEKVTGYVELWNDNIVENYKEDAKANGGRCGPRAFITMGYFEVDGYMRDAGVSGGRPWIGSSEPYLWFSVTCEGLGEFRLKKCLKCPNHKNVPKEENPQEPDWNTEYTGLNIMLPYFYNPTLKVIHKIDVDILCKICD